ncbi:aminotransferase class I/II-fold pyridoxal phosphate-dependent enzyme [Providencia rettgeri]|uniref:threonine aldolase family protein n=1 Tax=Providencia TaxID=586 RepID=UPI001B35AAC8|nr:aminotransferase class I/II-fold pyridoxal phosphate-dependent enzyme [Providencia rettgeri]EJD6584456.1 aminotransferase class I/II-fold pyridoxal phosphate-dependent enzyme [Providencia rettgeri]ELR5251359.1 aminotransferase class I/II-fold pyridoxal phosphate-dependent enzyme [Providencia rettgeri]ELT5685802.1 aminotransferase class I/II-fold pyridoxal phosphate-dependent enzyme [Providencia rettgeri]MBQ0688340.1 aminotransferase class I/II-fold pyridoxal phosphate-dependent enzyme [Provi
MYSFLNDYNEIAHPAVMKTLNDLAGKRFKGYGTDETCSRVTEQVKARIGQPDADIHFFNGGTVTNLTVISHALRPHQAVIAVDSGHVATHETGAIEATGHKVITVSSPSGKLTPTLVANVLAEHNDEHSVQPKLVYISNSTEIGTVYRKHELLALREVCDKHGLLLFLDGARLASGLMSKASDLTIEDIAAVTDVFYIGGTKIGALTGEILVILNPALKSDFRYSIKQKGGLQAKGWLLAAQFEPLFNNELYFELGHHLNEMASQLALFFEEQGFEFLAPVESNQVFVILPNSLADNLLKHYQLSKIGNPTTETTCVRFCTAWSTTQQDIDKFKQVFHTLS